MKRCCYIYSLALGLTMVVGCDQKAPTLPADAPDADAPRTRKAAAIEHWQVPGKVSMLGFDKQGKLLAASMPLEGMVETTRIITIDTATGKGSQIDVEPLFLQQVILLPDGVSLLGTPASGTQEPDSPHSVGTYKILKLPDCAVTEEFKAPYGAVLAPDGSALLASNARTSQFDVFSGQDGKKLGSVKATEGEFALIGPGASIWRLVRKIHLPGSLR